MEGGGGAEGGPCCQVSLCLLPPSPSPVTVEPRVNRLCHGDLWICATDLLLPTVDGLFSFQCRILHANIIHAAHFHNISKYQKVF